MISLSYMSSAQMVAQYICTKNYFYTWKINTFYGEDSRRSKNDLEKNKDFILFSFIINMTKTSK